MKKIDSNLFNFNFFLSNRKKVETLENGALLYGGATMFDDGIYSNIQNDEFIEVSEKNNEISIFVPSTMDIDNTIDNEYFIEKSIEFINNYYDIAENLKFYKTSGSWFSDILNNVIVENITIITLKLEKLTENDINIFVSLADMLKNEMKQENVSISINTSLAIV